ncbi:hypothetical protein [Ornithinibacillus bavariensis]|uniref:HMA domain-containing protein n=1 Tax=Ornithinibacillus bavariensis TaxID=545502 RepID=A0A920C6A4_9BACI|nr:hypothetical protein [Ornithinibacillus bavariensis]GIO25929.1 hypothetical protein J43TS3_05400 [Ornithinibacillus bavariensis]
MREYTLFVNEATTEPNIYRMEEILNQLTGVERVLVDTNDGEVKIEYDEKLLSEDTIVMTLIENNFTILP